MVRLDILLKLFIAFAVFSGCSPPHDDPFAPPNWTPADDTREFWDVIYLQGDKVGYQHTQVTPVAANNRELVKVDVVNQVAIKRFGQLTQTKISYTSLETPDGGIVWFKSNFGNGPSEITSRGMTKDGKLHIETNTEGRTQVDVQDWDDSWGGFYALQQSLTRKPMQSGETRRLRFLMEGQNALADVELEAGEREETSLLAGNQRLLRIDATIQMPGSKFEQTMWTNEHGEPLKSVVPFLNLTVYRTAEQFATRPPDEAQFDFGEMSIVRLKQPLADPHGRKRVVYRARLSSGTIAGVFASGPSQSVKILGDNSAEVTVVAIRPDQPAELETELAAPTTDDLGPNSLIQCDDARIKEMAEQAATDERDPWKTALDLEKFVNRSITEKNFSQAVATAADVARDLEGDCTEHAVLLAALCRARQIPARVAVGLVHFRDSQGNGFAYHMWNEVWIKDRWVPLDATLARGGIGGGHLKLADSNLKGASPLSVFTPVLNVMGRLELDVIQAE